MFEFAIRREGSEPKKDAPPGANTPPSLATRRPPLALTSTPPGTGVAFLVATWATTKTVPVNSLRVGTVDGVTVTVTHSLLPDGAVCCEAGTRVWLTGFH